MAKKTKDSNLSIEERLEQALIPNWDEPYKLPENWCWVILSTVCSLENGEKSTEKGLVYLDAKTLRGVTEPQTRDSGIVVNKDQKVILVDGENSGEVFVVPYRGYMGSTFKILNIVTNADEMYIRYFIDQNRERLRNSKVGSAIPHLNKDLFFDLKLPFPPLSEQKRIVAHIETLFAKLDEAKEKAQEVVDGFETRKAAILHKAFEGSLTESWREEQYIENEWVTDKLSNVCTLRSGTTIPSEEELEFGQIPYIKVSDMNLPENSIQITTSSRFVNTCPKSHLIPYGSTIFPKRGGAILTNKKRFIGVDKIIADLNTMAIIPDPIKLKGWYCYYWMLSVDLRKLYNGANVPQINNKDMVDLKIPVPSLEEQDEIIRILDELLSKEQQAKETVEAVIEQIDTMKKAILARAFRGELGTNDPSEESAVELLKKVLSGGEN